MRAPKNPKSIRMETAVYQQVKEAACISKEPMQSWVQRVLLEAVQKVKECRLHPEKIPTLFDIDNNFLCEHGFHDRINCKVCKTKRCKHCGQSRYLHLGPSEECVQGGLETCFEDEVCLST